MIPSNALILKESTEACTHLRRNTVFVHRLIAAQLPWFYGRAQRRTILLLDGVDPRRDKYRSALLFARPPCDIVKFVSIRVLDHRVPLEVVETNHEIT